MKRWIGWTIGLIVLWAVPAAPSAAAGLGKIEDIKVPPGAAGFRGTLQGKIVSVDDTEGTFVVEVEKVGRTLNGNTAKKPKAMLAHPVRIYPSVVRAKDGGLQPDPDQTRFIRQLHPGMKLLITVKSDGLFRFRMVGIPVKPRMGT